MSIEQGFFSEEILKFVSDVVYWSGEEGAMSEQSKMTPGLRRWREARALSLRNLATLAGVNYVTVLHLEQGKHGAYPTTIRKLADALGVTPEQLRETP